MLEGEIHIHAPQPDLIDSTFRHCYDCRQNQDFVEWHIPYYGWSGICLFCGGEYQDDEWMSTYWSRSMVISSRRQKNILRAKRRLNSRER